MSGLGKVQKLIESELDKFEVWFRASLKSKVALLDRIMYYIIKRKGKKMRPMFVFLSAKMLDKTTSEAAYIGASMIELLHTATLVHDDIVDDAETRRGFFTINKLWKNKIAVLVGDFLLSKGLLLAVEHEKFDMLKITSNAVKEMSEGELLQIEKTRKLDITETTYYEIIRKKTAVLIAACCAIGASAANAKKEDIEKMRLFGEYVGIAFQIKDDLFDYGSSQLIGKAIGMDIKEKKINLPLIYALNQASKKEKKSIIYDLKNNNTKSKKVAEIISFVKGSKGIEYAEEKMKHFTEKALEVLITMPQNEFNIGLQSLVNYTVERTK